MSPAMEQDPFSQKARTRKWQELGRFMGIALSVALLALGIHWGLGWKGTWFWGPLAILGLAVIIKVVKTLSRP
jgi:hypothetical protein